MEIGIVDLDILGNIIPFTHKSISMIIEEKATLYVDCK